MKNKTILIAHNYSTDTVSAMSYHLAHYLSNNGYKVVFLSHKPYFENEFTDNKIVVYSWDTKTRPTKLSNVIWFAKLYLKHKPSVIISHFVSVNITTIVSKILSFWKVKTYAYYHTISAATQIDLDAKERGDLIQQLIKKIKLLRKGVVYKLFCDKIIVPSELAFKDLKTIFGVTKAVKVLNSIPDRYSKVSLDYLNTSNINISFLGRINISKGIFLLAEAFNEYCFENPNTIITLRIAGAGETDVLKQIISSNSKIIYVGALNYQKVDEYLRESTFSIIPSFSDNLPTVGIESLMNGIPVLISTQTGLTLELKDGYDCFVFNPNKEEIKKVFARIENGLIDMDDLKKNARKSFLEKFGMDSYCMNMTKLIEDKVSRL